MKKVPVSKFAFLLLLFSLICFLMYQEYQDYQNLFSLEGKDSDIADFVPFKNVKVHKDVLNPLTRMSKSAGRDLVELKPLYGYLETQEIRNLSNNLL